MIDGHKNILVWLPSPMGDAILCTPALKSLRKRFSDDHITFLATDTVRTILSPCDYNDDWITLEDGCFALAGKLRKRKFDTAILFKNSFRSALTTFLADIPERIGYARDMRKILLTQPVSPAKNSSGKFKPGSMIDYYLNLCGTLGCDVSRQMELHIDEAARTAMLKKLPEIASADNEPVVILVPGGAFGPSKCWPAERFAQLADRFCNNYNAKVVVSVAPNEPEQKIAKQITQTASSPILSLADISLSLGELKALIARADLVVTNDTGPRHIAIALKRKLITLFGPNNPEWTKTGYADEVQIIGHAPCVPCDKPVCREQTHKCMESITVDQVYAAAETFLS